MDECPLIHELRKGLHIRDKFLSSQLYKQQKTGQFCDIKLIIGEKKWEVTAHKAVLAANSPYFETMFSSSFVEKVQSEIVIDPPSDIIDDEDAVQLVLQFIYTGHVDSDLLSLDTMCKVCQIAQLWLMDKLRKLVEYYLAANLTFENCEKLNTFARTNNLTTLYESSLRFVLSNLDGYSPNDSANLEFFIKDPLLLNQVNLIIEESSEDKTTLIAINKANILRTNVMGFLTQLNFGMDTNFYETVGIKVCLDGETILIEDFEIRLPDFVDKFHSSFSKRFGSPEDISGSHIVSFASIKDNIYFGIANNFKFSAILKYSIPFETWDILPFIPGSIEANFTNSRFNPVTFFVKEVKGEKELMVMNIQRNISSSEGTQLVIRSFEDGALIVQHEVNKVNIPSGSLFFNESPNVCQVGEELFFVFEKELLVFDSDQLFHCITPRDLDLFEPSKEDYRLLAVPSLDIHEELIILVHVKYRPNGSAVLSSAWKEEDCKYRLHAFRYNVRKGFLHIPQPPLINLGYFPVNGFLRNDTVCCFGFLENKESFVLSFNAGSRSWAEEKGFNIKTNNPELTHTVLYPTAC